MNELSADTWQWVQHVVEQASLLDGRERLAYLDQTCGGHLVARRRIEAMLAAENDATFMEIPAISRDDRPEIPGYVIHERLGSGGMGVVYRAERVAGDMRKPVAIKMLRRGMDTDRVVRRFRLERRTLAQLDHPNIVTAIDGGSTADGRPYLVMELIDDGVPIDEFCRTRNLDFRARVRLAEKVCAAVAYAHRHLVVHRDLKPGNILVTPSGEPKLLDFGVAKILDPDQQLTVTHRRERLLTPRYASPEQIQGEVVTTATDVYALGVVLYEILAGRSPYDLDTTSSAQLERLVCSTDPVRPSSASQHTTEGDAKAMRRVRSALRGDLDVIIMKALSKDPARRYSGADALAEDLRHYLAAEPIAARPPSTGYRMAMFLRRHRVRLLWSSVGGGGVAVIAAALVMFLVVMPQNASRALNDAHAVLLGPDSQSAIYDIAFFRPARTELVIDTIDVERDVEMLTRAIRHYDRAVRWAPFGDNIQDEREIMRTARELRRLDPNTDVPAQLLSELNPEAVHLLTAEEWSAAAAEASPDALREAGLVLFLARPGQRGLDLLRAYEDRADPDLLVEGLLGEMYLACGHPGLAYPRLRATYEAYPDSRAQALALAEAAIALGDHARASRLLDQAETLPDADLHDRLARVRALALAAAGHNDMARTAYDHATRVNATHGGHPNPVAVTAFGRFLEACDDVDGALGQYARSATASSAAAPAEAYVRLMSTWVESWNANTRRIWLTKAFETPRELNIGTDRRGSLIVIPFGPREMLQMYLDFRKELPKRIPPVMVTAAQAEEHAQRRLEWTEPTAASRLAEMMRVDDDQFWNDILKASGADRSAIIEAWTKGDENAAIRLIEQFRNHDH